MKKLYFFSCIFSILIAPVLTCVFPGTIISNILLIIQWNWIFCMIFLFKTTGKEVFKNTRGGTFNSVIFNVFASEKEISLIEDTEWIKEKTEFGIDIIEDEDLDNK